VRNSLTGLEGVKEVEVDLDEKTAVVIYEIAKVDVVKMIKATTDVGFPSSIQEEIHKVVIHKKVVTH